MLTDLSFIADGKPWPPEDKDEAARLAEHARNRDLYNGLHERVFVQYAKYLANTAQDPRKSKIILDWPAMATDTYMSLLWGEKPEAIAGDRPDLPERPDGQVFTDVSRYGLGFYEISDAGIQALNPENCYIIISPENIQKPSAFCFFRTWKAEMQEYIKFTIHSKGQIQHLVYELSGATNFQNISGRKLRGPLALEDFPAFAGLVVGSYGIQKPPVDDMLVVPVHNQLTSERYYGRSDYRPSIVSLVESLESLFSRRAEVLAKFASPTPVIPESATVFDPNLKEWVFRPGQAIITQPGDVPPSLMIWDASLSQVNAAIDQTMDQLLQMLQLTRVLLAGKDAGAAESGTALRLRLIPTLAKVSRAAREAEKAIPKVISLWSQLDGNGPTISEEDIAVNLQDGIPDDPMEIAQTSLLWDQMGGMSLERKLVLQGFKPGTAAFEEELDRIRATRIEEPFI